VGLVLPPDSIDHIITLLVASGGSTVPDNCSGTFTKPMVGKPLIELTATKDEVSLVSPLLLTSLGSHVERLNITNAVRIIIQSFFIIVVLWRDYAVN
jgi:hypothetical protein